MKKFNLALYSLLFASIFLFSCTDEDSEIPVPNNITENPVETPTTQNPSNQAPVTKTVTTVNITSPGSLQSSLSQTQLDTITKIIIKGTIDKRDFTTISTMPMISVLDLSEANIVAYSSYPKDQVPQYILAYKTSLTSVILPKSANSIGYNAFKGCKNLASVNIPVGLDSICEKAFSDCSSLTSITFPTTVKFIDDYAFEKCSGLSSLTIPSSMNCINVGTFEYCTALKTVTLPSSVQAISGCAFLGCSALTSITIPAFCTFIGNYSFQNCSSLTTINIPSYVDNIGDCVFNNCIKLTSIYAYPSTPVDIQTKTTVFNNVNKTSCTLKVPAGKKSLYQAANQWKDFTNIVEM